MLSKLISLNVSMFSCHRVKIQLGKQPTVSELDMDKISVRVKGGMSLRNGMWHGLRNDIIMRNLIYAAE